MYPHERSLVKKLEGKPFTILGINSDKDREKIKQVMKEENISWRSWFDGGGTGGPIATSWNVSAWPTIYVLDAKGVIRYKNVRGEQLEEAIDTLLAELDDNAGDAGQEH
jgi:hypothetical protein